MKKIAFALAVVFLFAACLPISIPGLSTPTADVNVTAAPATESSPPLSSPTPAPVNPSVSPASSSLTPENTVAFPPSPDLTVTLATSTDLPINPTVTPLATKVVAGQATATPTLGILTYGTLPPEVPFNTITVLNRSKAQAYISLQVTLNDGRYAILEYPVAGQIKIKAPLGSYIYVAWVGGNKMDGGFRLHSSDSLNIILYKDRVVIK